MKRLALLMTLVACAGELPVEIRFENASDQSFDSLDVGFGEAAEFDALAPGERTEYQVFEGAYGYGFVRVVVGTDEYESRPIDFVGERHLQPGSYTNRIEITGPPPNGLSNAMRRD